MDKEVDPAVLEVINEKRLAGEKRTPVEIITRMGVPEAREKASESAWLATGDVVIATVWAEFVSVGAGGRWFCLEWLDAERRIGGGDRSASQAQRAGNRLDLLKRALDAGRGFRAVLQTNRVPIRDVETDRSARVSTRVPDDEEWHVATWDADRKLAVLVRGPSAWVPSAEEIEAARARGAVPPQPAASSGPSTPEALHAAAMDHLTRHFAGYGYKADDVAGQGLGYDIEVSDKKGTVLLRLAVKGTAPGMASFRLTPEERACAQRGDPWRLAVVTDASGPAAQHKLYKPAEIDQVSGLEAS